MAQADEVMVKPVTTYMEGAEHKNERSDPYRVPRWHGEELAAHGFARIVKGDAGSEPEASENTDQAQDAADETSSDAANRPRGRRGATRG